MPAPAAFARAAPRLRSMSEARAPDCNAADWRGGRAATYISTADAERQRSSGSRHARTQRSSRAGRGLFYPAEPDALRALIAEMRAGRAARRRRRAESRRRPACRHRLFRLGRRHRLRRPGRGAPSRRTNRHRRARPSRRLQRARDPSGRGLERRRSARSRSRATCTSRLAEARAAAVDPRPFAGEHSLEMHLVMLQAMLPAPFEILPILVGDATPARSPPRCGSSGAGRRRSSRSPPTCRISSISAAPARSTTTPPGGSRVSTSARSRAGAPAATCRSAAR